MLGRRDRGDPEAPGGRRVEQRQRRRCAARRRARSSRAASSSGTSSGAASAASVSRTSSPRRASATSGTIRSRGGEAGPVRRARRRRARTRSRRRPPARRRAARRARRPPRRPASARQRRRDAREAVRRRRRRAARTQPERGERGAVAVGLLEAEPVLARRAREAKTTALGSTSAPTRTVRPSEHLPPAAPRTAHRALAARAQPASAWRRDAARRSAPADRRPCAGADPTRLTEWPLTPVRRTARRPSPEALAWPSAQPARSARAADAPVAAIGDGRRAAAILERRGCIVRQLAQHAAVGTRCVVLRGERGAANGSLRTPSYESEQRRAGAAFVVAIGVCRGEGRDWSVRLRPRRAEHAARGAGPTRVARLPQRRLRHRPRCGELLGLERTVEQVGDRARPSARRDQPRDPARRSAPRSGSTRADSPAVRRRRARPRADLPRVAVRSSRCAAAGACARTAAAARRLRLRSRRARARSRSRRCGPSRPARTAATMRSNASILSHVPGDLDDHRAPVTSMILPRKISTICMTSPRDGAVGGDLEQRQLARDRLGRLEVADLDHVDQLVQLLGHLVDRVHRPVERERDARQRRSSVGPTASVSMLKPRRANRPGDAGQHAGLVLDQDREDVLAAGAQRRRTPRAPRASAAPWFPARPWPQPTISRAAAPGAIIGYVFSSRVTRTSTTTGPGRRERRAAGRRPASSCRSAARRCAP